MIAGERRVGCAPEAEEIEVTEEMIDAGLEAMEPFTFTSMEGYDMEPALAAAFKAMCKIHQAACAEESPKRSIALTISTSNVFSSSSVTTL